MLEEDPHDGGGQKHSDSSWQQNFPSHFHQLIEAIAREGAAVPDVEIHECGNLGGEPENILHPVAYGRNEEDESDKAKCGAESRETEGLDAEVRVLGHARDVVERHAGEEQK